MERINSNVRDLLVIVMAIIMGIAWLVLEPGTTRNLTIAGTTAGLVIALWSIRTINRIHIHKPHIPSHNPTKSNKDDANISSPTNPFESLDACLRFYRVANHPSAQILCERVEDYRTIVVKMVNERDGKGTLWRDPDDDHRINACLCGKLTREEVIKSLDLLIAETDPPLVGAGMGIAPVLAGESRTRGTILAEDGHPATRVLIDPVVDRAITDLIAFRPEAKRAFMAVRERYTENILRRLIGPLDDMGKSIIPLCRWRKRFDGDYYNSFEEIEQQFQGS